MDLSVIIETLKILLPALLVIPATYYSQRRLRREERTYTLIHRTYLSEGLHHIEGTLSAFGTSTTTALADIRREVSRLRENPKIIEKLGLKLSEMREREDVASLINRNYGIAAQSFPRLQRFGMPLYNAIKRTFYSYSRWLEDSTNIGFLETQIKNMEEFLGEKRGMHAVTTILQDTEIYLERRLRQLDDYVWRKDYKNYMDFLKITEEPAFQRFKSELEEYVKKLDAWNSSLGGTSEERRRASSELSKWLSEHIDIDPFTEKI